MERNTPVLSIRRHGGSQLEEPQAVIQPAISVRLQYKATYIIHAQGAKVMCCCVQATLCAASVSLTLTRLSACIALFL